MSINEGLIRDALLRSTPGDLDEVLATIETYRVCVTAAQRLRGATGMLDRLDQAVGCAGYCRKALEEYVETGQLGTARSAESGEVHFVLVMDQAATWGRQ